MRKSDRARIGESERYEQPGSEQVGGLQNATTWSSTLLTRTFYSTHPAVFSASYEHLQSYSSGDAYSGRYVQC